MKRVTKWHILLIGSLLLALAGLFLWWGFCYVSAKLDKILIVLATSLLLFISSLFFILFACSFGKKHNVFLYDKKTKREIEVEDLTFERVCEFLDLYMGLVFYRTKHISLSDFRRDDFLASVPKKFHPLILMNLLLIWMEIGTHEQWKQLAQTDKKSVDAIENILLNCGEHVISSKVQYLRASYTGDDTEIKTFFLNNIEYLKGFILDYVKNHIHAFD
jgi:hypothetical protein